MAEVVTARQGQALGQRGDELAEFEAAHEDLELGRDSRRGRAHRPASVTLANSEGSRAKRPWITTGSGAHAGIGVFSGPLEHARDEVHVDGLGLEGPTTSQLDPLGSPLLDQAQEAVDLAHLGPGQRRVQDGGGIEADGGTVIGGHAPEALDVAGGVDLGARRHVGGIGGLATWWLAGVDLDQLALQVQLDRGRVAPGPQCSPDQVVRHRVDRLVHFDVEVPVDLGIGPPRHVEGCAGPGQEQRELFGTEGLDGPALGGAVDAHAGGGRAPGLGAHPAVGQVDEGLSGEEVVLHVVHDAFDAWLVGRGGHPGGVDDEAAGLGVLHEGVVDPRCGVLGGDDDRLHVVGDDDGEHPAEVAPGRLEAPDHLLGGLEERRPDELVTAGARREDEPVADPPALPVGDQSEASEVDLELLSGRRVGDSDRDRPSPRPAALDTETSQGARRDHHPPAGQQDADLGDREVIFQPPLMRSSSPSSVRQASPWPSGRCGRTRSTTWPISSSPSCSSPPERSTPSSMAAAM